MTTAQIVSIVHALRIIAEGESYNMDGRMAERAAKLTGRLETEVSGVLRAAIKREEQERAGRGKYEAAMRSCCDHFVNWLGDAENFSVDDLIQFVATHDPLCVYAVLLGQHLSQ